jgi:hypothetical protein
VISIILSFILRRISSCLYPVPASIYSRGISIVGILSAEKKFFV